MKTRPDDATEGPETTMMYHLMLVRMVIAKRLQITAGEGVERREPSDIAGAATMENTGESHSVMSNSATPWTTQSMEFSRPEYWNG